MFYFIKDSPLFNSLVSVQTHYYVLRTECVTIYDRLTEYTAGHLSQHDRDYWTCNEVWENLSGFLLFFQCFRYILCKTRKSLNCNQSKSISFELWHCSSITTRILTFEAERNSVILQPKLKKIVLKKNIPKISQKWMKTFHVTFFKLYLFFAKVCCVLEMCYFLLIVLWQLGYPVFPFSHM